jgi:hypothetical protein
MIFRAARARYYEREAEVERAKSGKTFRSSRKHVRAAQRLERRAAKLRARINDPADSASAP